MSKKREKSLDTTMLIIDMMKRIPRDRKVSASELHKQLINAGWDREFRTIQRQLEDLADHFNEHLECDKTTKPYGYKWLPNATVLTVPTLTTQESLLMLLAEQHLRNLLPASLMKSMDGFFKSARANLDPYGSKGKMEREWMSKVRVVSTTQPLIPPKIKDSVLDEVSNALYRNQWLAVEYRNAAGRKTNADVMPLGLAQQGPRLYLVCRYRGFDNERSLAVHRIISAKASTLTFDRPKDFNLEKYDNDGRFGFGEGRRIKLSFRIEKDEGFHLLESPLSKDQQVKELDDCYEIEATVVDSLQLEWWLRGFGGSVSNVNRTIISE